MKKVSRNVVITGGTSGIGKACAQYFLNKNDNVIILARKNLEGLSNFYPCDVSDLEQVKKVFKEIGQKFKHIDILINNAGSGVSGAVELTPDEDIKNLFGVNVFGVINCFKECLPLMNNGAKIFNISSVCAFFPLPFRALYCASKSAVNMLSYSIDMECRPFGIRVCAVCPGDVKTNFTKNRVKITKTDSKYGKRIKNAADKIDKKDETRMNPDIVAKAVFKLSLKKNPKPYVIVGGKYKVLDFAMRFLPLRLLLKVTSKFFGGFKTQKEENK